MRIINGIEELEQAVGTHLGYSEWHAVTQDQIELSADATVGLRQHRRGD